MADDLYDAFGDGDVYFDDEEEGSETVEGEGQNRLFLIIAGGMALMLICTVGLFAWWFMTQSPAAQQRIADGGAQTDGTPTEMVGVDLSDPTETATLEPTETATPTPTATPTNTPTPTPVVGEPATPTPENGEGDVDGDNGDITPTPARERRTATPTPTPRNTPTPRPGSDAAGGPTTTPDTGFGEVLLIISGFLILGMAFMIRRLRNA